MNKLSFKFGTVGSPTSTPKKPGGSVGAVMRLAEMQLETLELGWVQSVRVKEETCITIRDAAETHQVALSVHAPYFINLNANEQEWPKSRKRLMDAAHYGFLAGATDIIFHPGSYFGLEPDQVLPVAIDRLGECVHELQQAGNTVILRPETMGKGAMLGSLEDTLRMSQAIENVQPCIDFAHLYARTGDGSVNDYDSWAQGLQAYAEALGQEALQSLHIHLSGIAFGPKGEKEHLPVQESGLKIEEIFKALHAFSCRGRILCESPAMEDDALYMKEIWCKISAEDPAEDEV